MYLYFTTLSTAYSDKSRTECTTAEPLAQGGSETIVPDSAAAAAAVDNWDAKPCAEWAARAPGAETETVIRNSRVE